MKQQVTKQAIETLHEGVWEWIVPTGEVYFSDELIAMLGYTRSSFGEGLDAWKDKVHPDDLAEVQHRLELHLHGHMDYYSSEHRLKTADGGWIKVLDRGSIVERDARHQPVKLVGFHTNIEKYVYQNKPDPYLVSQLKVRHGEVENIGVQVSHEGIIKYVTANVTSLSGHAPEHLTGGSIGMLFDDNSRQKVQKLLRTEGFHHFTVRLKKAGDDLKTIVLDLSMDISEHRNDTITITLKPHKATLKEIESIEKQIEFEHLLLQISSGFINESPVGANRQIEQALARAGSFMEVDRAYVFVYDADAATMSNTHEWVGAGIEPQKENLQHLPVSMFPWWTQQINQNTEISYYDIRHLPDEAGAEREILAMQDIKSICIVPLFLHGNVKGFVGFDAVKQHRMFESLTVTLLRFFANLIAGAITRAEQHTKLLDYGLNLENLVKEQHADLVDTNQKLSKALNEQISLSEELHRFKIALETSHHGVAIVMPDEIIEYANPSLHKIFGFREGFLEGKRIQDVISESSQVLLDTVRKELAMKGSFNNNELLLRHQDGHPVPLLLSGTRIPGSHFDNNPSDFYFVINFFDLSYRRQIEQKLAESEQRYRAMFEHSKDGIVLLDTEGVIQEANKTFAGWVNQPEGELKGKNIAAFTPANDGLTVKERLARVLADGHQVFEAKLEGFTQDYEIETSASPVTLDGQQFIQTNARDITAKLKDEYEKRLLWKVVENAGFGVVIVSREGTIRYSNSFYQQRMGYSREELLNIPVTQFLTGRYSDELITMIKKVAEQGRSWRGRVTNRTKGGELFQEEMTVVPVKNHHGQISEYIILKKDITHEINMDKVLKDTEKLRALGTLSGGIAHDFNNILQVVMAQTDLIELVKMPEERSAVVADIKSAVRKGSQVVRAILSYSKNSQEGVREMQANAPVAEAVVLFGNIMNKAIVLSTSLQATGVVEGDLSSLETAFLNLLINAQQAITENGKIEIVTKTVNVEMDGRQDPREMVLYSFRDTGSGMSPEIKERIFEPFFTTKRIGEGTGLGLPMVYNTINLHNGFIEVDSEVGIGTEFRIYLQLKK